MLYRLVDPVGEATDAGYTYDKCHRSKTFPPCGVGKLKVMLILHRTQKQLAHHAQDIDPGDYDG